MDKYPVFREEQTVGELTVAPDALYTAFSVSCRGREGLWCAWAVGRQGISVSVFWNRRTAACKSAAGFPND